MDEFNREFSRKHLLIIIWTLCSFAIIFTTARFLIRLKLFKRFLLDDAFLVFALICDIASTILITRITNNLYAQQAVVYEHHGKPPNYKEASSNYADEEWANAYLFFSCLWSVKASFLAFYGNLTKGLKAYRIAWWALIGLCILTYIGCLISYPFLNITGNTTERTKLNRSYSITYEFSVDVVTDILIMLLPLSLALKANIPLTRKLNLVAVFSLGLIITAFAILRYAIDNPYGADYGPSWIISWSAVQLNVALMVACLSAFRSLALDHQRSNVAISKDNNTSSDQNRTYGSSNRGPYQRGSTLWAPGASTAGRDPRSRSEESMAIELLETGGPKSSSQTRTLPHESDGVDSPLSTSYPGTAR